MDTTTGEDSEERSFDAFEDADLAALAAIAGRDLERFVARNARHASLPGRVLIVALCQGAGLHFVDGRNGVKDFDLWTFFAADAVSPDYPVRRRGIASFAGERFRDSTGRVDLLGRTLPVIPDSDPVLAVEAYLRGGKTKSARCLARKAVVAVSPPALRGTIIWPPVPDCDLSLPVRDTAR